MANAFIIRPLPLTSVSAEGSAAGTSPANLGNDFIGVVHRGTGAASGHVQVDLGAAQPVDFAAFLSAGVAAGATLRVRADDDSDVVSAPSYDSGTLGFAAGSALPTSLRQNSWWEHATGLTLQHWRFDLASLAAPFEAGRLVIGKRLALLRNFSFGASRGARDLGSVDFSSRGVLVRRAGVRLRTLQLAYQASSKAEIEEQVLPLFESLGNSAPLLVVTDPAADAQRSRRMYFGFLVGELTSVQRWSDGFEWRCNLASLI